MLGDLVVRVVVDVLVVKVVWCLVLIRQMSLQKPRRAHRRG